MRHIIPVGYIILLAFLGLLMGFGLARVVDDGYFARWHQLPSTPEPIAAFITSTTDTVYAVAASGAVLSCTEWRAECWIPDSVPQGEWEGFPTTITRPCNRQSPEFSLLALPPRHMVDCLQSRTQYPDGDMRHTYALDTNGNAWEWTWSTSVYSSFGRLLAFAFLGLVLGLSVGVLTWRLKHQRQPRRPAPTGTDA